jgi:hypothetical protein
MWTMFRKIKPPPSRAEGLPNTISVIFSLVGDVNQLDRSITSLPRSLFQARLEHFIQNYRESVEKVNVFGSIYDARKAMYVRWVGSDEGFEAARYRVELAEVIADSPSPPIWPVFCLLLSLLKARLKDPYVDMMLKTAFTGNFVDCYMWALHEKITFNECLEKYPWLTILPGQKHPMVGANVCPMLRHAKTLPIPQDTLNFPMYLKPGVFLIVSDKDPASKTDSWTSNFVIQQLLLQLSSLLVMYLIVYAHAYPSSPLIRAVLPGFVILGFLLTSWKSYWLVSSSKSHKERRSSTFGAFSILQSIFSYNILTATLPIALCTIYHQDFSAGCWITAVLFLTIFEVSNRLTGYEQDVIDKPTSILIKYPEVIQFLPVFYGSFYLLMSEFAPADLYYTFLLWNVNTLWHCYVDNGMITKSLFSCIGILFQEDIVRHFLGLSVNASWFWISFFLVGTIQDSHDHDGDRATKRNTLPTVLGKKNWEYLYYTQLPVYFAYWCLLPSSLVEKLVEICVVVLIYGLLDKDDDLAYQVWSVWYCFKFCHHLSVESK